MPFLSFVLAVVVLALDVPIWAQVKSSIDEEGMWSNEAKSLSYFPKPQQIRIDAPDKRTVAVLDGLKLLVLRDGKKLPGIEDEGVVGPAELAWAPDSKGFFITWSDGGWVGTWRTDVYLIEKERVRRVDVTQEVKRESKKNYKGIKPEALNIAAVKWLKGSRNLVLVGEVPPSSFYPEMGKVIGYIVSVPSGKIVEQFGERRLKAVWGRYLGPRLSREEKK
jgi:hypothetical protein